MRLNFSDKFIIINGVNGLVGSSVADLCKKNNLQYVGLDISENSAHEHFIKINDTSLKSLQETTQKVLSEYNPYSWINCSFPRSNGFKNDPYQVDSDTWENELVGHLGSYAQTSLDACNYWKLKNISGCVINTGSIFGLISHPKAFYDMEKTYPSIPYSAIKGGIQSFTKFLAGYFGEFGIRANSVVPGAIKGSKMQSKSDFIIEFEKHTMLGRLGEPEEISNLYLYLLSNQASYITAQNIIVDGGYSSY